MLPLCVDDAVENVFIEKNNQKDYKKSKRCGVGICLEWRRMCRKCSNNNVNKTCSNERSL